MRPTGFQRVLLLALTTALAIVLLGDGSVVGAARVDAQTSSEASDLPAGAPERTTTDQASAIPQPAPTDPQLFDLALAQNELDALEREADGLRRELADALEAINALRTERDFLDLNRPARGEALDQARAEARQMAVAAYVGIGPPLQGIDLLHAETASEMSWRNALLLQQAERLNQAAETYAILAGEADSDVLALTDDISDETRQLEELNRKLSRVTDRMPQAAWYISIARIHDEADAEFRQRGRVDPTPAQWQALRRCESTETYNIDTGNTFYGAYQFTWDTWETVGGSGNPALAPPAEQDARARLLYSRRGNQPWPICGRFLP